MSYKVQNRQSIFDVALTTTGSIESVVDIARLNNLDLNNALNTSNIEIPKVINQYIVDYLNRNSIVLVSEANTVFVATPNDTGYTPQPPSEVVPAPVSGSNIEVLTDDRIRLNFGNGRVFELKVMSHHDDKRHSLGIEKI